MLAIQFQFSIYPSNRGKYSLLASNRTICLMIPRHGIQIYLLGDRSFVLKQIALKSSIAAGTYVKSLGEAYCSKLRRERKECISEIKTRNYCFLGTSTPRFILEGKFDILLIYLVRLPIVM